MTNLSPASAKREQPATRASLLFARALRCQRGYDLWQSIHHPNLQQQIYVRFHTQRLACSTASLLPRLSLDLLTFPGAFAMPLPWPRGDVPSVPRSYPQYAHSPLFLSSFSPSLKSFVTARVFQVSGKRTTRWEGRPSLLPCSTGQKLWALPPSKSRSCVLLY